MKRLVLAALITASLSLGSSFASVLIFSNDIRGELEPCGCSRIQLGGMKRLENFVESTRNKEKHILQLDGGNLLFENDSIPALLKDQAILQAKTTLLSMEEIGLNAFTPGTMDFALGVSQFLEITRNSKVDVLAINIFRNKKRLFKPHEIYTVGTTRVLVIGLVSPELIWPRELKIQNPKPLLEATLKKLKGKFDLLILLTHQGLEADKALAKDFPQTDAIVGAHSQSFLQKPEMVGKTGIFQTSFLNQYIGSVPFSQKFDFDHYQLIPLDADLSPGSKKKTKVTKLIDDFKAEIAKTDSKTDSDLEIEKHFQTFPSCVSCHNQQFQSWLKTNHFKALKPLAKSKQLRNKSCLQCHTLGLGHPKGFSNLNQIAIFKGAGPQEMYGMNINELEKYLEHLSQKGISEAYPVAGKLQKPLDSFEKGAQIWAPVQCENCHGPALDHPFTLNYSKKVNENRCLECHTKERAPAWYRKNGTLDRATFQAKLKEVSCPSTDK